MRTSPNSRKGVLKSCLPGRSQIAQHIDDDDGGGGGRPTTDDRLPSLCCSVGTVRGSGAWAAHGPLRNVARTCTLEHHIVAKWLLRARICAKFGSVGMARRDPRTTKFQERQRLLCSSQSELCNADSGQNSADPSDRLGAQFAHPFDWPSEDFPRVGPPDMPNLSVQGDRRPTTTTNTTMTGGVGPPSDHGPRTSDCLID